MKAFDVFELIHTINDMGYVVMFRKEFDGTASAYITKTGDIWGWLDAEVVTGRRNDYQRLFTALHAWIEKKSSNQ